MTKSLSEYTIEEIRALPATHETNALVYAALGHPRTRFDGETFVDCSVPYSTDIGAAWELIASVGFATIERWMDGDGMKANYCANLCDSRNTSFAGCADTAPLAIVRAFLLMKKAQ